MATVGDIIRRIRKEKGLSQAELSRRSGISQAGISAIESGANARAPYSDTLEKLAEGLSCTVAELLGEDTEGFILTAEEELIITAYRAASEPIRGAVRDILHVVTKKRPAAAERAI